MLKNSRMKDPDVSGPSAAKQGKMDLELSDNIMHYQLVVRSGTYQGIVEINKLFVILTFLERVGGCIELQEEGWSSNWCIIGS